MTWAQYFTSSKVKATSRGRYAISIHHISPAELCFNIVLCVTVTGRNYSRCRQTSLEHHRHVGQSVPSFTHRSEMLSASLCTPITSLMGDMQQGQFMAGFVTAVPRGPAHSFTSGSIMQRGHSWLGLTE